MHTNQPYDVIVIGEGIAGLAVAGLLAKQGRRVASFEGGAFGGLVLNISDLDPAPAGAPASGADYAATLLMENVKHGVQRHEEPVQSVTPGETGHVVAAQGITIAAPQVVVASGARWNTLGVPGELEFEGRGVSHCADCDGPMFSGGEVVVVGGGDSALQEALTLSEYAAHVHLLVRGSEFSGQPRLAELLRGKPNVRVAFGTEVVAITGDGGVSAVTVRLVNDGSTRTLACTGVFPFIGLLANTDFVPAAVQRDAQGRIKTDERLSTSIPGLWAIGAVRSGGDGLLSGALADAAKVAAAITA